jgi:serine/threonine protein kinase
VAPPGRGIPASCVKLLDFGIAKLVEESADGGGATLLTREAGWAMTPEYAAPEQIRGEPVSTATDVFSLGVLLYVMLTGHHPAADAVKSPVELIKAIVDTDPPRSRAASASRRPGRRGRQRRLPRGAARPPTSSAGCCGAISRRSSPRRSRRNRRSATHRETAVSLSGS